MTERDYVQEMEMNKEAYRISIAEFKQWLEDFGAVEKFHKALATESVWFVAIDYSIPVIMVKHFKKMAF